MASDLLPKNDQGDDIEKESCSSEEDTNDTREETKRTENGIHDRKNLLATFWELVSLNEEARVTSVLTLMSEIKKSEHHTEDLGYVVQRLVKGLGSSRKAARQGYATALVHVLKGNPELKPELILELMSEHLAVKGSLKGQEEKDAYFGQVFSILVLCRSRLFVNDSLDKPLLGKIIGILLALMKKKSYLQEICCKTIEGIFQKVDYSTFDEVILPHIQELIMKGWATCTPTDLYLAMAVQNQYKPLLPKKFFSEKWGGSDLFASKHFKNLGKVLIESTNTAHPRVHSIWDMVIQRTIEKSSESLSIFWKVVVQDGLLQSTHERKFLALNLLLKFTPLISEEHVAIVFSPDILRLIFNSCQSKDNYLFRATRTILDKLPVEAAKNEDKNVITTLIKTLVGKDGNPHFDSITKTKTVEQLVSKISKDSLTGYRLWLEGVFLQGSFPISEGVENGIDKDSTQSKESDAEDVDKTAKVCREWVAMQLMLLLKTYKQIKDESSLMQIGLFFFTHAFFDVIKRKKKHSIIGSLPTLPISDSTRQFCQKKFESVLTELTNIHHVVSGSSKQFVCGCAEDGEFFASKFLSYAKELLDQPKYIQLVTAWTPQIHDSFSNVIETLKVIKEKDAPETKGFELIFIHSALHLFSNGEEAVDILQELQTCYEKSSEKKKSKNKAEPHWTEVLVEILLGFLTQQSNLMRQVVDHVFTTILPHLVPGALNQLLDAIKPKEKGGGENLEYESESAGEDEEQDEDQDEEENKESLTNGEDKQSESEDESSGEESGDENEEDNMEIDEAFKAELKAALGDAAAEKDSEEDDEEDSGSSDEDLDMDTVDPKLMENMDKALAAVFKVRNQVKDEKKKKRDLEKDILHYKLRVMDLIEIFIKKQPKNPLILQIMNPLLEVLKSTSSKNEQVLFQRTMGILKNKLCQLHEYPEASSLNVEDTHNQIKDLFDVSKTMMSLQISNAVGLAIVYLVRVLRGSVESKGPSVPETRGQRKKRKAKAEAEDDVEKPSDGGCLDEDVLISCCKDVLSDFMTKRSSHVQPAIFKELMQRFPSLGWKIGMLLPEYLYTACNTFRKMKACELLQNMLSKKHASYSDSMEQILPSLSTGISKVLLYSSETDCSLKARHVHDLVHLCDTLAKQVYTANVTWEESDKLSLSDALSASIEGPIVKRSPQLESYSKRVLTYIQNPEMQPVKKRKRK